ncbi:MAG: hypothetical protein WA418_08105 [Bradyrhizobium sp.]
MMRPEGFLRALGPWSEKEDLCDAFTRLLETTPEGGVEFAECLAVAQRINGEDADSWYREWMRCADAMRAGASAMADAGALEGGRSKWVRAIDYYDVAASAFGSCTVRQQAVAAGIRDCAIDYLSHGVPSGEVVTIPWRTDYPLEAYFLPAPDRREPAPTVICICEPGRRKEKSLLMLAGHAAQRGLSLLVVDLLGPGLANRFDEIVGHRDLESAIASVMDYVSARDDVDDARIAVLADDWSSSFVARGIVLDPRYAAAVCDAGLWDIHERVCLSHRLTPSERACRPGASDCRVARQIMCPLLVALPERGWLRADIATRLVAQMKREHPDVTLKIFSGCQAAPDEAQANAFIFDWIATRLACVPNRQS